ncbi:hypothetical protein GCM10009021_01360 [Halarchaeum nitratireducens]|uniref:Uncharacterized protein n=1 Tax=Halarchaeum nitratireducens TaxID=489913 RepID=A0A830G6J7_9EURY|nr:hypothetical protein GCM10009021_01360 [Halarchaeum nitratireducens]
MLAEPRLDPIADGRLVVVGGDRDEVAGQRFEFVHASADGGERENSGGDERAVRESGVRTPVWGFLDTLIRHRRVGAGI